MIPDEWHKDLKRMERTARQLWERAHDFAYDFETMWRLAKERYEPALVWTVMPDKNGNSEPTLVLNLAARGKRDLLDLPERTLGEIMEGAINTMAAMKSTAPLKKLHALLAGILEQTEAAIREKEQRERAIEAFLLGEPQPIQEIKE